MGSIMGGGGHRVLRRSSLTSSREGRQGRGLPSLLVLSARADFLKPGHTSQKADLPVDSTLPLTSTNDHFLITWPPSLTRIASAVNYRPGLEPEKREGRKC